MPNLPCIQSSSPTSATTFGSRDPALRPLDRHPRRPIRQNDQELSRTSLFCALHLPPHRRQARRLHLSQESLHSRLQALRRHHRRPPIYPKDRSRLRIYLPRSRQGSRRQLRAPHHLRSRRAQRQRPRRIGRLRATQCSTHHDASR